VTDRPARRFRAGRALGGLPQWSGPYAQRKTAATLARWGRDCHLCADRTTPADSADHLTPRSRGGGDDVETNLRPAHGNCNRARQDKTLAEWFAGHPLPTRPALPPSRKWYT
jgi:5-methylcytosine-specific restriction endonuclease McrA